MTIAEYAEYVLLTKRLTILHPKISSLQNPDLPEIEFSLKEVQDIEAVIQSLQSIKRVYGEQS